MYEIEAIEDAFVGALQPLKTAGTVRTLETYGGQLNVEDLADLTLLFPAVYVMWNGSEISELSRLDQLVARVTLIVCEQSLRGQAAARRGAPESAGVYTILEQTRALLHRKSVLSGWTPATLTREAPLAYDQEGGIAVYEAVYRMKARV